VNLMLAIGGTEIIWQKTLQQFGFAEKEILNFIPGPAYTTGWLMGNLEGWGGPVTGDVITRQSTISFGPYQNRQADKCLPKHI
jgi:alpha-N-acetylglucosaminidase